MKRAIFVDLDGTLNDNNERWARFKSGEITKEQFHSMEEVLKDKPVHSIIRLVEDLGAWNTIILLTARQWVDYDVTNEWLNRNRIKVDQIVMEADGSPRSAAEFKVDQYNRLKEQYDLWLAIDDNLEVCRALRATGLTVLQPRECSY